MDEWYFEQWEKKGVQAVTADRSAEFSVVMEAARETIAAGRMFRVLAPARATPQEILDLQALGSVEWLGDHKGAAR